VPHAHTTKAPRPRRVRFLTRGRGRLDANVMLGDGQAIGPYLASRPGAVSLTHAEWLESGEREEQLTLRLGEIVWVQPLDQNVPLANVMPAERERVPVEVVLAEGGTVRGVLLLAQGQSLTSYLSAMNPFPALRDVRAGEEQVGDVALNVAGIQSVRDLSVPEDAACWEPERNTATSHWIVNVARRARLPGLAELRLPPSTPVLDVWRTVCVAAEIEEEALADAIAAELRLDRVDHAALDATLEGVPRSLQERFGVRAVGDDGRTLTVATADPMNADIEQALAFACKRRIRLVMASPRELGLQAAPRVGTEAELEMLLAEVPWSMGDAVQLEEDAEPQEVDVDQISAEPIIKLSNVILREAVRQNASDIHLEPDQARGIVRFRVDGVLRPYMHIPLASLHRVISRYKIVCRLDIADRVRPQDGSVRIRVDARSFELRLSTVPTQDAEKAVIRIAGSVSEQTLDQLDLPVPELKRLRQLLARRDGIIVVTGPTGSGKTSTLYGALNELNTGDVNIMTVEDPVERALPGTTQIQVQPRRGVTFASALRAILRQDPDVILVGEIRDLETAEIAVQAAMTGHLVLTTLHTTSAVGVVARLRDIGLDPGTLAASLRGVVAQRLARRVCASCAGSGCGSCGGTGYRGRLPVMEVLTAGPEFADLIVHGELQRLQDAAVRSGMRPIRDVATERVAEGLTTHAEVLRVLGDESEYYEPEQRLGGAPPRRLAPGTGELIDDDVIIDVEPIGATAHDAPAGTTLPVVAGQSEAGGEWVDEEARQRSEILRGLLQGLDRCVAEGQPVAEVLQFACDRLATAFDSPLVWIATLEQEALAIRARAGACAPYVHDLVPEWTDLHESDGAVATALRTREPQGCRLDDEPGFESWREHARTHGLHIFLAVPMDTGDAAIGVVGMHARSIQSLDQRAGRELLNVVERITGVIQRLQQLEALGVHLSALELAADAVFTTDRRGIIQWVNRSFTKLTGFSAQDAIGSPASILRSDRQDGAFYRDMWSAILGGTPWRGELYNLCKDGTLVAVEQTITPITDEQGIVTHFLSVQRDITQRKQREQDVHALVTRDPLTGLPNARALEAELTTLIAAAATAGEAALLLMHVDGAAAVEDACGADTLERLLGVVAKRLQDTLRPGDYLARLGDHEFAALLPVTPQQGAIRAADRLRRAVAERATGADVLPDLPVAPGVSVGIACIDGTQGARAVLAMADAALYGSRDRRDGVAISTPDAPDVEPAANSEWAQRITTALSDDHFFLHFQPVVRLDTRAVTHYDALLRLHDENGEVIPARAFITHAERLGLMPQLDRWVVENVLRLLQMSPDLRISLNLGASTVASAGFRQFLLRQSRRMNAVGNRIIFEVGEAATPQELPHMVDNMNRLRELGCRFALDNFGIGGQSLASLGALPVDYVKLDGSLVRGIDLDHDRHEIVRSLAIVARALGKEVIAGWAERQSIVELLPQLGIELAQGHYLGLPGPELRRAVPVTEHAAGAASNGIAEAGELISTGFDQGQRAIATA
jgi:general secretion pathway protein E